MFVAVFVVSSVACGGGLVTHHRIGIEQATVFTYLDHGHGAERGRVRDCDAEVVSEQTVDVFFLARLQLVFRHTSPAREPRAVWVSREMCVGVILSPADEQDDQDDLGTAGVSNVIVFVRVCGVDVVRVIVCRCNPAVSVDSGSESWEVVAVAVPATEATRTATPVLSGFRVIGAPLPARPAGRGRGRFARADVFLWRLEVESSVPEESLDEIVAAPSATKSNQELLAKLHLSSGRTFMDLPVVPAHELLHREIEEQPELADAVDLVAASSEWTPTYTRATYRRWF